MKTRNLVAFIDGTGKNDFKQPEESRSNISRIWHACEKMANEGDVEQRVLYKPGVGTRYFEVVCGSIFGRRLSERVRELKTWLTNEINVAKADGVEPRIFIFGFSRGAYAARWLANELDSDIEVLGVFDTVKTTIKGPDVDKASARIKHIFHAMSIDEHREPFNITRFKDSPQAAEVWFPGDHSDVGGGHDDGKAELSYISLNWMIRMVEKFGLLIDKEKIHKEEPLCGTEFKVHNLKRAGSGLLMKYIDRDIAATDFVCPLVKDLMEVQSLAYNPKNLPDNYVAWNDGDIGVRNMV